MWLGRYGVDGLHAAAMAPDDADTPHTTEQGPAITVWQRLGEALSRRFPAAQGMAEGSPCGTLVTHPPHACGLDFGLAWDRLWAHDTLRYMARDPIHRGFHQHELTSRMAHAWGERFVLPLSHPHVAPGRGSLLAQMPGDRWRQFANLRLLYGSMWGQPGKKLMFMGCEFAQLAEWNRDASLDWHLLGDAMHRGVQDWVADLNRLHRDLPALHELDHDPAGFAWIDSSDTVNSVLAWLRRSRDGDRVLVVCNFTPVPRPGYRVGVPAGGEWRELANSDAVQYGGSGVGNFGGVWAQAAPAHGHAWSVELTLPPLAVLMLREVGP
jgi:1,4-alpha-glucan branching enzyme